MYLELILDIKISNFLFCHGRGNVSLKFLMVEGFAVLNSIYAFLFLQFLIVKQIRVKERNQRKRY